MYFHYFLIISHLKKGGPFIWTNLSTHHPRMHCAMFGWNWPSGSGEEDFFNFVNVFLLFHNYLPLEKGGALHLNKIQESFVPSLVEIGPVVLKRRWKCEKFTTTPTTTTDNGHILIRKAHLSLRLSCTKKGSLILNHPHSIRDSTMTESCQKR